MVIDLGASVAGECYDGTGSGCYHIMRDVGQSHPSHSLSDE